MEAVFLKTINNTINHWYIPVLVGAFFVIVSIVAFTRPAGLLLALSLLFAYSFLLGGLSKIIFSDANKVQLNGAGRWHLQSALL